MKLLCSACGNYTYFVCDVQCFKRVIATPEGVLIENAVIDGWNWTDSSLREDLIDQVDYAIKQSGEVLYRDESSGHYLSKIITCGRCHSKRVTVPYSDWQPSRDRESLEDELIEGREEYKQLRKERAYENNLPVLWKP